MDTVAEIRPIAETMSMNIGNAMIQLAIATTTDLCEVVALQTAKAHIESEVERRLKLYAYDKAALAGQGKEADIGYLNAASARRKEGLATRISHAIYTDLLTREEQLKYTYNITNDEYVLNEALKPKATKPANFTDYDAPVLETDGPKENPLKAPPVIPD